MLSLFGFVTALLPGFAQVAWYYFTSPLIVRNICYGPNPRNYLDIYLPVEDEDEDDGGTADGNSPQAPEDPLDVLQRKRRPVVRLARAPALGRSGCVRELTVRCVGPARASPPPSWSLSRAACGPSATRRGARSLAASWRRRAS